MITLIYRPSKRRFDRTPPPSAYAPEMLQDFEKVPLACLLQCTHTLNVDVGYKARSGHMGFVAINPYGLLHNPCRYMVFITPRACARSKVIGRIVVVIVVVVVIVSTKMAISQDVGI